MASRSSKRAGDRILESRHLVGLFLGVVLLCAVFFTLGYVMGRTQYSGSVHAADALPHPSAAPVVPKAKDKEPAASARNTAEWDFYPDKAAKNNHLVPSSHSQNGSENLSGDASPEQSAPTQAPPARYQAPRILKGSIVLQVAAVSRASDALAMADALQQKKFPSFVVAPAGDNLYRVQVGPYSNDHSAEAAKAALDRLGFKAILKR